MGAGLIFLISLIFLLVLEHSATPHTPDELHFQKWSSDRMMQTVPIKQLREHPIRSLWYLHIQPPFLDTVRAVIAQFYRSVDEETLLGKVDQTMYILWAMVASLIAALICQWGSAMVGLPWSAAAAFLWIFHPAAIFYATLLESTLLSAFGVTWFFYEMWRARTGRQKGFFRLSSALLFVYFTRTIFQWYFLPVFFCSLWMMGYPLKKIGSSFLVSILKFF